MQRGSRDSIERRGVVLGTQEDVRDLLLFQSTNIQIRGIVSAVSRSSLKHEVPLLFVVSFNSPFNHAVNGMWTSSPSLLAVPDFLSSAPEKVWKMSSHCSVFRSPSARFGTSGGATDHQYSAADA